MYEHRPIIVATLAGRKRYLQVLAVYLVSNRALVDAWHICVNTDVEEDLAYLYHLREALPDFVKLVFPNNADGPEKPFVANFSQFYKYLTAESTIYIKLDDDIVFVGHEALQQLVEFRVKNPEPFLISANVVNNSICTHILQRMGRMGIESGIAGYTAGCPTGWNSGTFAESVHEAFLSIAPDTVRYEYERWEMFEPIQYSINAICWFGHDMKVAEVGYNCDDEKYFTIEYPRKARRHNCIAGRAVVAHFAFWTQREHLDKTGLLDRYRRLAASMDSRAYKQVPQ